MEAIGGKLLVKSYLHQKEALTIKGKGGKKIELFVGRKYLENNREKNPVVVEVISNKTKYEYIKPGDVLLVHHNMVDSPLTNQYCIEFDPQTGIGLYSIPAAAPQIFCKLRKDGTAEPICGNILVERIEGKLQSKFIIIPESVKNHHDDRVKVLSISKEVDGVKAGDVIGIYKYADYEICYSWNKKDFRVIKVNAEDVLWQWN